MAYVDPTQDPSQQDENQSQTDQALNPQGSSSQSSQNQATDTPPSTSAGGAGVVSGGGGNVGGNASTPAPAAAKPSSSGSWTNLSSYLDANSDQAAQIGQQIAGTVNSEGNQAQNDVNSLNSNFNSAVNANTVSQDPKAVNAAIGDATSATASNPMINPNDLSGFQAQANASYGGPTDVTGFNGYSQAQQDINTASNNANATQSEAGRDVLLNQQYAGASANGYNQGENNLDQLLLEDSPGAQSALQPLAQQWSGLGGALSNAVSTGNANATAASSTDQATSNAAEGALNTATQNFENQINSGLQNLQSQDTNSYNQVLADIQNGQISSADYAALGIDPNAHNYLYQNTSATAQPVYTNDMANYLTQGAAPTLQSYATTDQYAQAAALAQLAGQSSSGYLAPGSVSQAGTAETAPAYTFNGAQYNNDNQTAQSEYSTNQQNMLTKLNNGFVTPGGSPFAFQYGSIPEAVTDLNKYVSSYSGLPASNGYGALAIWAKQQLDLINQAQQASGFPTYPVVGENTAVIK